MPGVCEFYIAHKVYSVGIKVMCLLCIPEIMIAMSLVFVKNSEDYLCGISKLDNIVTMSQFQRINRMSRKQVKLNKKLNEIKTMSDIDSLIAQTPYQERRETAGFQK